MTYYIYDSTTKALTALPHRIGLKFNPSAAEYAARSPPGYPLAATQPQPSPPSGKTAVPDGYELVSGAWSRKWAYVDEPAPAVAPLPENPTTLEVVSKVRELVAAVSCLLLAFSLPAASVHSAPLSVLRLPSQVVTNVTFEGLALEENVPAKVSDLRNDLGFATSNSVPGRTSDLINDSGFTTSNDVAGVRRDFETKVLETVITNRTYNLIPDRRLGVIWKDDADGGRFFARCYTNDLSVLEVEP